MGVLSLEKAIQKLGNLTNLKMAKYCSAGFLEKILEDTSLSADEKAEKISDLIYDLIQKK